MQRFVVASLLAASGSFAAPLTWEQAYEKASKTLSQMSRDEKNSMMHSRQDQAGGWFVGNINPIGRLGVPSLNMQDNGNGFRTTEDYMVGTVTCWPSSLAMAATWDPELVHASATAIGEEFATKGANVILGPGVFVIRVAKGGRNFETLAGEDPFLGARLGEQFIAGVQSQNVIATMKHWVFNSQENERGTFDAHVDDKTAWELYYPAYQAAVDAGVGAVMCSYNKVDGKHSCANSQRLKDHLKGTMGFKGFVMSDWGAEHETSIDEGLDMDMVNGAGGDGFNAGSVSEAGVNDAVTRSLATIYKMHLDTTTKCVGGACSGPLHADAQSGNGHKEMARKAATESVVLLKNEGILPLSSNTVKKIRVVGSAATAQALKHLPEWFSPDLYSGGGSGHVIPGYVVTPMDGIKARAKLAGIEVVDGSSQEEVDVTIVVGGTTTYESKDRDHLHLDDDADNLIASIAGGGPLPGVCPSGQKHFDARGSCCCDCSWARAGTCGRDDGSCCFQCCHHLGDAAKANATLQAPLAKKPKVVVLLEIPGAVLMPWADDVGAIAALFIGGQETGNAWASVLFGDHSPTGRLPISIPASEHDLIEPGSGTITYSEGLATGYRSQHFKHLFQFGHGLTYTDFTYSEAKVSSTTESCKQNLCVSFTLKNTGDVASAAVPQLYLEFPKVAGHPAPFLKGFSKTKVLESAEELVVTFEVSERDLSYWQSGSWIRADTVTAHIGASSADLQLSLVVNLAARVTEEIVV